MRLYVVSWIMPNTFNIAIFSKKENQRIIWIQHVFVTPALNLAADLYFSVSTIQLSMQNDGK